MEQLSLFFSKFFNIVIPFLERVLPTSPFRAYLEGYEDGGSGLLSAVNYFVPIGTFIAITEAWVTAMFLYYLYHGLIDKIWHSGDKENLKEKSQFFGGIFNAVKKLFGKL